MRDEVERLAGGNYLLVTTFRRDGTPKPTPVWVVSEDGRLLAWTATDSYKVKRIRNNPAVRLAPCDVRGRPTGDEIDGTAQVLDDDGSDRVRALIRRKYPVTGPLVVLGSRLRRGRTGSVGVEFTVDGPGDEPA